MRIDEDAPTRPVGDGDAGRSAAYSTQASERTAKANSPDVRRRILHSARPILFAIVAVALGTGSATLVASRSEPIYAARSEIVLEPTDRGGEQLRTFMATQVVIAESRATLLPVANTLGIPIETMEKRFSAEFVSGSTVLRLEYRDADPDVAIRIVQAATERYLAALRLSEAVRRGTHQVLVPPFILEQPVWPRLPQVAAIGAVAGLAAAALLLLARASRLR